jgi:hypothetical protein
MKRYHWSLIAYLTLSLGVPSSAAAEPIPLGPVETSSSLDRGPNVDWVDRGPIVRALDPEEARIWTESPPDTDRPVVNDREAILPDPLNSQELVARVLGQETREGPILVATTPAALPQRVHDHQRIAPNFVVPIASGTRR